MKLKLIEYIRNNEWEKIKALDPKIVVENLSFNDCLRFVYAILEKGWEFETQPFAVELLLALREVHRLQWDSSWKYDAFLGSVYDDAMDYDKRYEFYKRAYNKAPEPKPPKLLIELAQCTICPGVPPISADFAICLIKEAMRNHLYADGAGLLRHIYSHIDDVQQETYWAKIYEELEEKRQYSPSIYPECLQEALA